MMDKLKNICLALLAAIALAACGPKDDLTEAQKACMSNNFSQYKPSDLEQCVNACKVCRNGNTTTCTTSCRLKGAT
ncbi:MAG: hypothetical protein V4661_15770 [Pseudomonadota bacterium]